MAFSCLLLQILWPIIYSGSHLVLAWDSCLLQFCPDAAGYEKKKAAFIAAYREVTPVTEEELDLVSYAGLAIWLYYLGVQCERFDKISNFFLSENYVKMFLGRVKRWMKYHNIEIPGS